MEYFKCKWIHDFRDEPILLFSEIDEDRYETRKIEIFRNNKIGFADSLEEVNNTLLGKMPVPSLEEINNMKNSKQLRFQKKNLNKFGSIERILQK